MTIVAARIDGRLIHGQVANLWSTKLNVGRIMVLDDIAVNSDLEKTALKLATPPGVKLSVLTVEKAVANILAGKYDSQRLMIVARRPDKFLGLVEGGVKLEELNVGNMSQTPETKSVTRTVHVVQEDIDVFDKLVSHGVKLIAQMVPNDSPSDFVPLLDKVR